ncbi:nucleoside-triphosphatase [Anaerotignum sp.]|uniref:nucleoside-triphosphatase n=1 Tax=Anaerotignum sp. TaxID=2039241 RepID=UPI00331AAB35
MITNFLITGKKGVGKSFLAKKVLDNLKESYVGYQTLPYYINNKIRGHYFHSLIDLAEIENDLPFTIRHKKDSCIYNKEVFQIIGIPCLTKSLLSSEKIVLLDELGVAELENLDYLNQVEKLFNSNKIVIAILKKVDSYFIINLKKREDIVLIDLDDTTQEVALKELLEKIGGKLNEK